MKKTISINISGVIFHIEEDGYEKLRNYLTTIQQYFSTYEDSQEIITDIENRIAEKLLAKLKAADKQASPRQVVTLDDVNELVAAMGTVADFEAVEEEEILVTGGGRHSATGAGSIPPNNPRPENAAGGTYSSQPADGGAYNQPRRLVRDLRRKTLGGVAAGLAHYFNWDVVWVRLIFVALVVGLPALLGASPNGEFFGGLSGFTVFAYIAMWIALPGVGTIEEDKTVKKFYRNPEDKVLGGVASGLAAYFGVDIGVVRLLFVLGIVLFGAGFLLYIVLWLISPQANTLTEKMEMQGQPITLSNIEYSIKQNLNIDETPNNESTLTRILLFPFRAISLIINGLGSALGPLLNGTVTLIRVIAGVALLIAAVAGIVTCLIILGAAVGIGSGMPFSHSLPVDLFRADITMPMILSTFLLGFLPALGLGILGVMLITNRAVIHSRTALALAGVWLVSILVFGGTAMPLIHGFQRRGTVEETKVLTIAADTPTFALNDNDEDSFGENPSIELMGYEGTTINLVQHFRAQGSTRAEAQANARQLEYSYVVRDSVVQFNNTTELKSGAHFRAQDLDMELMIPYEKSFRMTEEFARYIRNEFGEKEINRMPGSIWKFTRTEGLVCLNFPREKDYQGSDEDNDVTDITDDVQGVVTNELGDDFDRIGANTRQFSVTSFEKVDISGAFVVRFRKGDVYKVVADGREEDLEDIGVKVDGDQLKVSINGKGVFNWGNRKRIGLTITVPTINELRLSGASKASLVGFGNFDDLDLDMSGACRTVFEGTVNKLSVDMSGASNVVLRGQIKTLDIDLSGASKVEATGTTVDKAVVEASGASHVDLGHVTSLESEASGASKVTRQE
jgi:phage shock protein PspC (stress-responsive transcriptional regulator)